MLPADQSGHRSGRIMKILTGSICELGYLVRQSTILEARRAWAQRTNELGQKEQNNITMETC